MKKTIEERNKQVCEEYKKMRTIKDIANQFNLTPERISQILKENNIKTNRVAVYKNFYKLCGEYYEITLLNGEVLFIDKEDYDKVSKYSWCIGAGNRVVANIKGKLTYLHKYILGNKDGIVDHINGNNRDNRKINLRVTDAKGNARNNISHNKYGVNGIRKTPSGKYKARITVDYREICIGTFDTLDKAIEAREKAEQKYFGDFAPTKRYKIKNFCKNREN